MFTQKFAIYGDAEKLSETARTLISKFGYAMDSSYDKKGVGQSYLVTCYNAGNNKIGYSDNLKERYCVPVERRELILGLAAMASDTRYQDMEPVISSSGTYQLVQGLRDRLVAGSSYRRATKEDVFKNHGVPVPVVGQKPPEPSFVNTGLAVDPTNPLSIKVGDFVKVEQRLPEDSYKKYEIGATFAVSGLEKSVYPHAWWVHGPNGPIPITCLSRINSSFKKGDRVWITHWHYDSSLKPQLATVDSINDISASLKLDKPHKIGQYWSFKLDEFRLATPDEISGKSSELPFKVGDYVWIMYWAFDSTFKPQLGKMAYPYTDGSALIAPVVQYRNSINWHFSKGEFRHATAEEIKQAEPMNPLLNPFFAVGTYVTLISGGYVGIKVGDAIQVTSNSKGERNTIADGTTNYFSKDFRLSTQQEIQQLLERRKTGSGEWKAQKGDYIYILENTSSHSLTIGQVYRVGETSITYVVVDNGSHAPGVYHKDYRKATHPEIAASLSLIDRSGEDDFGRPDKVTASEIAYADKQYADFKAKQAQGKTSRPKLAIYEEVGDYPYDAELREEIVRTELNQSSVSNKIDTRVNNMESVNIPLLQPKKVTLF